MQNRHERRSSKRRETKSLPQHTPRRTKPEISIDEQKRAQRKLIRHVQPQHAAHFLAEAQRPQPPPIFLTGPQVCRRYGISAPTLWRWLRDNGLAFPQPSLRVRDRRFWREADLLAWELRAAQDVRGGS